MKSSPFGRRALSLSNVSASSLCPANVGEASWGTYNFKAIVAYRGTAYKGWQIQNGKSAAPTIHQKLEEAIIAVKHEDRQILKLQASGRTDAGVHATAQVCNFFSRKMEPKPEKLVLAINHGLPRDIRVTSIQRVPLDFSARYSALAKVYSFRIQTGKVADPFLHGLSQHVHKDLDLHAMRFVGKMFEGKHDFTQFSSIPADGVRPHPVKVLYRVDVLEVHQGLKIVMDGSGFLYNQCRHIAGCLMQVGLGHLTPEAVLKLLQVGASQHPGLTYRGWPLAQAQGLFLDEVRYPDFIDHTEYLHPSLPHDKDGRVWLAERPRCENLEIEDMAGPG